MLHLDEAHPCFADIGFMGVSPEAKQRTRCSLKHADLKIEAGS
jgi:hypothetical protein